MRLQSALARGSRRRQTSHSIDSVHAMSHVAAETRKWVPIIRNAGISAE
jgi:hypothetical protein